MTLQEQNSLAYSGFILRMDDDARAAAFVAARRHSRFVRIFRVALPVTAVLVSIVIFTLSSLLSKTNMDFSVGNISISDQGLTMNNARLTGVDDDNQFYEVLADTATQSLTDPNLLSLERINARTLRDQDGQGWVDLEAAEGLYDRGKELLNLKNDIRVRSSEGYDVRMDTAEVDLEKGTVVTRDPVTIDMLNGTLHAQGMIIENSGELLHFFGGVSLNFIPRKAGEKTTETPNE